MRCCFNALIIIQNVISCEIIIQLATPQPHASENRVNFPVI